MLLISSAVRFIVASALPSRSRTGSRRLAVAVGALAALTLVAATTASAAPRTWPKVKGPGSLFVHYGEEHVDDDDGGRIFPKVIKDSARYRPDLVVTSADKVSDGTKNLLRSWRELMEKYDRERVPYFPGVGNHDRKAPPGFPGGISPVADLGNYERVFAGRPFPFGDAKPYRVPGLRPKKRPSDDPAGASSHYSFDYRNTRWIVIDNSCYGITNCDPLQNPPFPDDAGNSGQFEFLQERAADAKQRGMRVFVSMHMPTQDPRPEHVEPTPGPHTMGEGSSPDNALFEQAAAAADVDGVFLGHIKGQWTYRARGVPYYTDGGAGGEVYVGPAEEVGTDYGYWHGYRLVRVTNRGRIITDTVPVLVRDGITMKGPKRVAVDERAKFRAFGEQPTKEGPEVEALELRDPDRSRPNFANLPSPARIWTSGNRRVLKAIASPDDDPRRDARRQTDSGRFRAICPGTTKMHITSGWQKEGRRVSVSSRPGEILRSIRRGPRRIGRGDTPVAITRLAQPAQVKVTVRRGGRRVRTLDRRCERGGKLVTTWNGQADGRRVTPGRYTVVAGIRSDRAPVKRRFRVRVG